MTHDVLQKRLLTPAEQTIVYGMALGYPDAFTPDRMAMDEFVTWVKSVARNRVEAETAAGTRQLTGITILGRCLPTAAPDFVRTAAQLI